ncbi:acyl carrier protein [Pseudacidovorax intermedius]|uniref:Phosphopantetheine-binding protein n=1 Tax=Pseudacidovorax intermedius TaxID=433924 RepID=A0A147GLP4_9BURK|nr:acyl carrier protein [Pseudacidovorax intermedius]KTT14513.1 phosphopantetheine-binding protein [Pseudacidovorax intermedius]
MPSTTFQTIARIAEEEHRCDPALLKPEVPLADLGLDSLALMEFIFSVEDALKLRLPEERLDPREAGITLGDLCAAIDAHMAQQQGAGTASATPAHA